MKLLKLTLPLAAAPLIVLKCRSVRLFIWQLKAWNEEYDTLVYQDGERLLWLIGTEIDKNTEVIYHIHTDEPEKLPERRVQYGFDNRGFRVGAERAENELEQIDHYRVFEREIPEEYNVTAIVVGFNTEGTITWTESFRTGF